MQSTLSPATARGWNKGVAQTLFVTIMPVGGENKHNDFSILNFVDQSVPLADSTAPLARTVTSKWLGFTCSRSWMLIKFTNEGDGFLISLWLISKQAFQVFFSFGSNDYIVFHRLRMCRSNSSILVNERPLPSAISCLASSTRAKNSSFVICESSSCFWAASFFRYLTARLSSASSSAITPIARYISAFNCIGVIIGMALIMNTKILFYFISANIIPTKRHLEKLLQ